METYISMTGWVGSAVEYRSFTAPDRSFTTHRASFRLASTPRIRRADGWVDGVTNWITVVCSRALAQNVGASVSKGDPVHVWGKLRRETWEKDGESHERTVIEAVVIGHDLSRGTSMFKKTERSQPAEDLSADLGDMIQKVESEDSGDEADDDAGVSADGVTAEEPRFALA